jgi:hypothetical protein
MRDPYVDVVFDVPVTIDMTPEPGDPLGEFTQKMLYGDLATITKTFEERSEERFDLVRQAIRKAFGEHFGEATEAIVIASKLRDDIRAEILREGKSGGNMQISRQLVEHMQAHHAHAAEHHAKEARFHAKLAEHHSDDEELAGHYQKAHERHVEYAEHHSECAQKCEAMGKALEDELDKSLDDVSSINRNPEAGGVADRFRRQAVPRTGAPDKIDTESVPTELRHLVES